MTTEAQHSPAVDPVTATGATSQMRQALGRYGEDVAARHLTSLGMVVLDRNWRCPGGEIDLVLRDGQVLVVCEVKTRTSGACGTPLEAVTEEKARRLQRLAAAWREAHGVRAETRVDMVGVHRPRRGRALVEHVRGIA